jgi:hypothetical protein
VPLTRRVIDARFTSRRQLTKQVKAARAREWKPTRRWLEGEGKRYGRLIVINDTHPGAGRDPLTGKISPTEDFMPDRQEVDMRRLLESEWKAADADRRMRTLVLNGDVFEFMQTLRPADGARFAAGGGDEFGPANTARNTILKLHAIREGHPLMFGTWAEHLARGNRIVLLPGNHDRQLLHPAVRARLRTLLRRDLVAALLANPTFQAGTSGGARRLEAVREARRILAERFEFVPHFFVLGDVFAQHGNQNDPSNTFSSFIGDYYASPFTRDRVMEGALGDSAVKALFNRMELKLPWGNNEPGAWAKLKMVTSAVSPRGGRPFSPRELVRAIRYVFLSGGRGSDEEIAREQARDRADVARVIRDFKLTEKLNEVRPQNEPPLDEAQTLALVDAYRSRLAQPVMNQFRRGSSFARRLGIVLRRWPEVRRELASARRRDIEEVASAVLFGAMRMKVHLTGHDHRFRLQRYLVGPPGEERMASIMDNATWIDAMPGTSRTMMAVGGERRGVTTVDFDEQGSHPMLNHWDPVRNQLVPVSVLEGTREALGLE